MTLYHESYIFYNPIFAHFVAPLYIVSMRHSVAGAFGALSIGQIVMRQFVARFACLKLGAWGFPRLVLVAFYFYYTTISKKF